MIKKRKSKTKPIKVTQKELAEYLGLQAHTISSYKNSITGKKKLFLMLKGLKKIKIEQETEKINLNSNLKKDMEIL